MIVPGGDVNAVEIVRKPGQHGQVAIADTYDTRHYIEVKQVAPTSRRAAKFAPHQAAADDAKIDYTLLHLLRPQYRQCLFGHGSIMYQRHQCAHHLRRAFVLDDVAPVDDARRALPHQFIRAMDNLVVRSLAAAAHKHRTTGGDLDHARILARIVAGISLDHVRAQFNCLAHQWQNLIDVAIHHVSPGPRVDLHHQRLDHQGHTVAHTLLFQAADVLDALRVEFWLVRQEQQVDHHAGSIEGDGLLNRVFDQAAKKIAR